MIWVVNGSARAWAGDSRNVLKHSRQLAMGKRSNASARAVPISSSWYALLLLLFYSVFLLFSFVIETVRCNSFLFGPDMSRNPSKDAFPPVSPSRLLLFLGTQWSSNIVFHNFSPTVLLPFSLCFSLRGYLRTVQLSLSVAHFVAEDVTNPNPSYNFQSLFRFFVRFPVSCIFDKCLYYGVKIFSLILSLSSSLL